MFTLKITQNPQAINKAKDTAMFIGLNFRYKRVENSSITGIIINLIETIKNVELVLNVRE